MSDHSELKRLAEAIESCTSIPEADEAAWMCRTTGRAVGELLEELEIFKAEVPKWTEREIKLIAEKEKLKADLREVKDAKLGLSWAIGEIMGERDQLKVENESLREANDKFARRNGMLEENVQAMTETHVLYTWLRKKVDQPSNDFVAVQMNIGHDWVPVHDLDLDLRAMIEREEP